MSDEKPKVPPAARPPSPSGAPPKLERVPPGYRPPAVRPPAASAAAPAADVARPAPAVAAPPAPPPPPAPTYGLAAREVGPDAAIAAGLAHEGSIPSESALHLFALAAALHATGRLTLTPEGRSFTLSFRRGTVEHVASSDPDDDLGRFLVRKGTLRADALARAEAAKGAVGGDLVSALLTERLVNPAEVAALLQEHGGHLVQRALAVETGKWSWTPEAPPPGAFPLGSPFAMLCAAIRGVDATALVRRLGERHHRAASRSGGRLRLEDLHLTPQEARAAALFDGSRSPAEIAAASPGDALVVLRLAVLLGDVELLAFGASRKGASPPAAAAPAAPAAKPAVAAPAVAAPPKPAVAAPPAPAVAAPPKPAAAAPVAAAPKPAVAASLKPAVAAPKPAAAAPVAAAPKPVVAAPPKPAASPPPSAPALDRASLEALYARLSGADHFTVLGVKQDAPGAQIKLAYFQLAKSYHPDTVPVGAAQEVKKLCADVFAKVSEAWAVLGQDGSRAAYLEKLKSGGTVDVDVMNILQSENVFQAGELLVKARKYDEALGKFDEAMKLNPDEAEFGMWKAWCEFLLSTDKKKKVLQAGSAIELALRKNPRCAQGYLFLGQMAKIVGDLALAEKQLKRGLQVAPEHADLQRELKYLHR